MHSTIWTDILYVVVISKGSEDQVGCFKEIRERLGRCAPGVDPDNSENGCTGDLTDSSGFERSGVRSPGDKSDGWKICLCGEYSGDTMMPNHIQIAGICVPFLAA